MRTAAPRMLAVLLIFAGVGPLIGLLVLAIGIGVLALLGGHADGYFLTPVVLLYGILFAHYAGLKWALIAGACAFGLATAQPHAPIWIGPVAGLVSYATAAMLGAVWLPTGAEATLPGQVIEKSVIGFAIVMVLVHVLSATVCWWLSRKLVCHRTTA